jgi:uncharacterized protein YdeI (YjbR/CyaY-like superfamily)
MPRRDPRVDAYIAKSADFAKPILNHIREVVHAACPDTEETMKWSFPHFDYKGMLCGMAAFKQHCTLGFWKGSLIIDKATREKLSVEAMGSFGRLTTLSDLPSDKVLTGYIKAAMKLNDAGVPAPHMVNRKVKKALPVPAYLTAALKRNKKARDTFESFPPGHRREYIEWITEAKTEETRNRRIQTALEWMAEGKGRNWKYVKK